MEVSTSKGAGGVSLNDFYSPYFYSRIRYEFLGVFSYRKCSHPVHRNLLSEKPFWKCMEIPYLPSTSNPHSPVLSLLFVQKRSDLPIRLGGLFHRKRDDEVDL